MTLDAETWLPIPEYETFYEVSSTGRVRSLHSRNYGLIRAQQRSAFGYPTITLKVNGIKRNWCTHTLVAMAFHGPPSDPSLQVRHLDGDPTNNVPSNLAWGTQSENNFDIVRHGNHVSRRKTHCPKGHPLSGPNVYLYRNRRGCRRCMSQRTVAWQRRKAKEKRDAAPSL